MSGEARPGPAADVPLCVDLDGTLVKTDLLAESVLALLKRSPLALFALPYWLLEGKANLKRQVAMRAGVAPAGLPYHEGFLAFLKAERQAGRRLVLATASDKAFARAVADHLGIFSEAIGSDGVTNLSGEAKRRALQSRFPEGFDYAGDCEADLPVWAAARQAILVQPGDSLLAAVRATKPDCRVFREPRGLAREVLRVMRPHQWVKNLLVFVPAITSHQIVRPELFLRTLHAALAFSLCASSVYVLNDLLDIEADRSHRTKRGRPFASGALPTAWGPALAAVLLGSSAILAGFLPHQFCLVLGGYFLLTLTYSLRLKELPLVDVFCLAALYTLRIFAGHAVSDVPYSPWLMAFSIFIFISLAIMKRYVEVRALPPDLAQAPGRGYRASDAAVLLGMGTASGYISDLVFALYINSEQVVRLYARPVLIWPICLIILYFLSRLWFLAQRGGMDDGPVLFILKDKASYVCAVLVAMILVIASH